MENYILNISTLADLMHYNARRMLGAEKQLENIIPVWTKEIKSSSLIMALNTYMALVSDNIKDLRQHLNEEGIGALSCTNRIIQDMILESRETVSNCTNINIKQTMLLSAIQTIAHYKTAMYSNLALYAEITGKAGAATAFLRAKVQEEEVYNDLSDMAAQRVARNAFNTLLPQKFS